MKFYAASKKGLCAFLALSVTTSAVPALAWANGDPAGQERTMEVSAEEAEESDEVEETEETEESEEIEEVEEPEEVEASTEEKTEEKTEEAPLMTMSLEEEAAPVAEEQKGLAFDGAREYAAAASPITMPDTAEAWVKFDTQKRQIIMGNYGDKETPISWSVEMDDSGALRYWEKNNEKEFRCIFTAAKTDEGKAVQLKVGEWQLVSIVRDHENNKIKAYINGEYAGSVSVAEATPLNPNTTETTRPLQFGTDYRKNKFYFEGEIGEVRLWNDVRTDEEIKKYFTESVNGSEEGLNHCWDFGDIEGKAYNDTVVTDKTDNNNDVTTAGYEERPVAGERQGLDFKGSAANGNYARTEEPIEIPDTVEVWVKLKENENRRQIIMNNYLKEDTKSWGLEVNDDNTLRYWENVNGGSNGTDRISYKFTDVNICTDEWTLISVVRDKAESQVDVYINGEYKTSGNMLTDEWKFTDTELSTPTYIGTDLRKTYWLNGKIGEMRMFSDARTADEIKAYYNGTETNTDDLEHCWDFGDIDGKAYDSTVIEDKVGKNDIITEGFEANVEDCSGLVFDSEDQDYVQVQGTIDIPVTTEIRVKLDKDSKLSRQILMNNYGKDGASWGLEVAAGTDQLRHWASADAVNSTVFEDVSIKTGEWMLISVVRDAAKNELRAYVNGQLMQTVAMKEANNFKDAKLNNWLCFGSDYHATPIYFDGEINEVRMWSDVRTDAEIAEYYNKSVKGNEDGLAHAWSFASANGAEGSKKVYSDTVFADKVKTGGFEVKAVGYPDDPNTEYTVKFNIAGATVTGNASELDARTRKVNTKVAKPNVTLERGNSTFKGWFKDAACTIPWDFEKDTVKANTTIYAGFEYQYVSAELNLNGTNFANCADQLCAAEVLSDVPRTFEATIKVPQGLQGRAGVIVGNYAELGYYDYDLGYVNFEVAENGQPRLYWQQGRRNQPNGGKQSVVIPGIDLRQDDWVHVAMTFDEKEDIVSCYINGELVSVVEDCNFTPVVPAQALKIGGDYRGTGGMTTDAGYNSQYFKGEIANVSIWSDVRTAEEIKADFDALKKDSSVPSAGEGLLASWKFDKLAEGVYKDLTGRENNVAAFVDWLAPNFAKGDYTMIALPDTQFLSENYPDIFKKLTKWIADNQETYNIQAVMHLGDMVDDNTDAQWKALTDATDILDNAGVTWMPMRGNHDNSARFNQEYDYDVYSKKAWFVDSFKDGELDQHCWQVSEGGRDYLIFSFGYNPSSEALQWADDIIKANPDKNVILTAHAFMYWDSTLQDPSDLDVPSTDGQEIWDALGKTNPNVVLGLGGHIGFPDLPHCTHPNGAGKEVTSILCDAQGIDYVYGLGMMMMMTFHEGSDQVDVNWYSADNEMLFRERNQFQISVPHVTKGCFH